MSDKPELIEWREGKEGAWHGYLGAIEWCEWIPPYDDDDMRQGGYVFGIAIDGHMVDAETIKIGINRAESWTKEWVRLANLAKPSDISCGDGCLAVKGGDLCCGECAKVKIKNLFKYLDSFEYENDVVTIARIKNALPTRETP